MNEMFINLRKVSMKYVIIYLIIILLLINSKLFGGQNDFIKVLPGIGIVYNNDSIILNKTTINELNKILKIKDNSQRVEISIKIWDGVDPLTLRPISGTEYIREIEFKSIKFEFANKKDMDNLKLKCIKIRNGKTLKIFTVNGLTFGMINPKIRNFFPAIAKGDYISDDGLTFNLYSYGISIQLEKLKNNDLRLFEISIYLIQE